MSPPCRLRPKHTLDVASITAAAKLTPRAARIVLRQLRSAKPAIVKVQEVES